MQNSTVQEIHQIGHDRRFFQVGFLGFDEYPPERAEEPLLPDQNPLVKIMNKLESSSFNLFEEDDEILFSEKQHANATFNRKAQEKTSFLLRIPNFSRYFKQFHQKQLQDWFELSFSGEKNVKKLVCGGYHYFVLLENGDLYSCGFNRYGQLGLGDNQDRVFPTRMSKFLDEILKTNVKITKMKVPGRHSFILTSDNRLYSFGNAENGRLGHPSHNKTMELPQEIEFFNGSQLNQYFIDNHDNCTGLSLEIDLKIKKIVCGFWHTLVSLANGSVFGFGNNESGKLGIGLWNHEKSTQFQTQTPNSQQQSSPITRMNQLALQYSLQLQQQQQQPSQRTNNILHLIFNTNVAAPFSKTKNGDIYLRDVETPVEVHSLSGRGGIKSGCGGAYHSVVIMNDGSVLSCGSNFYGQTGHANDFEDTFIFKELEFFKGKKPKKVRCGANFSIILTESGECFGFGCTTSGKLGAIYQQKQIRSPMLLNFSSIPQPDLSNFSHEKSNEPNLNPEKMEIDDDKKNNMKISDISVGSNHSFFKSECGKVFSCGWSRYAQTGQGHFTNSSLKVLKEFSGKEVDKIHCGSFFTIVSTKSFIPKEKSKAIYSNLFGIWKDHSEKKSSASIHLSCDVVLICVT